MRQRGLTLVELVVVLLILVAVASVALRSTEGLVQQGRFDATGRTLGNVEDAVLGPKSLRDSRGALRITGFVADMGRLPRTSTEPVIGDLAARSSALIELYDGTGLTAASVTASAVDPEVTLVSGWNGPYLRLPVGPSELKDGYGNPLVFQYTAVGGVFEIRTATSPAGSRPAPWNLDLSVEFIGAIDRVAAGLQLHPRTLNLSASPQVPEGLQAANGNLVVVAFSPNGSGGVAEVSKYFPSSSLPTQVSFDLADGLTLGPRVLRAYQGNNLDDTNLQAQLAELRLGNTSFVEFMSPPVPVVLQAGVGNQLGTLVLDPVP